MTEPAFDSPAAVHVLAQDALVDPPASVIQSTPEGTTTIRKEVPPSWLHMNIRNLILVAVTVMVCYLAYTGVAEARSALIVTFASLASYLFAERAALKTPQNEKSESN